MKYIANRKTKTILKYGLWRRTEAVIRQFQHFDLPESCIVLDIGTADGLLLRSLIAHCRLSNSIAIGVDKEFRFLKTAQENLICAVQAGGKRLPLCSNSIDVIIMTAVLKHIRCPEELLLECRRVLKLAGRIIVTDPTPLGIHLGILLGHFTRKSIAQALSLKVTQEILTRYALRVIRAERFMLSPIPFIGCDIIERALKRVGLDQLFFNQVICGEALSTDTSVCQTT